MSGVWTQCNTSSNNKVKPKVVEHRQVQLVFEFRRAACGVWVEFNNSSNHSVKPKVIESRLVQLVFEFHRRAGFEHSDGGERNVKKRKNEKANSAGSSIVEISMARAGLSEQSELSNFVPCQHCTLLLCWFSNCHANIILTQDISEDFTSVLKVLGTSVAPCTHFGSKSSWGTSSVPHMHFGAKSSWGTSAAPHMHSGSKSS